MRLLKVVCCAAAITLCLAPGARADEWNKKTFLTFSGPVQIPGATLPAGTYQFQLADPDMARHVVMVSNKEGTKIYGMFITIPNDRLDTPDENVVMFGEAPAGTPQAVQAWWYPGDRIGEEFVYPKSQAVAIAKANHKEVLATDADLNSNGSESERHASLKGSKVSHVDENGNMKGEVAATNTADSVAQNNSRPAATTAQSTTAQSTTAQSTTAAPANTVDGRDMNSAKASTTTASAATTTASKNAKASTTTASSKRSNATVGTSGQANNNTAANNTANNDTSKNGKRNRKSLPRTASSLALIELLSGLALAGGFSARVLRTARAN